MSDVTNILSQIECGDPSAAEQLLPLVYDELRKLAAAKLAQEKPGQTLQATALVHDAYLRLVDVGKASIGIPVATSSRRQPRRCGGFLWIQHAGNGALSTVVGENVSISIPPARLPRIQAKTCWPWMRH
jgi:hypothetical protein